jgi:hypothetical protein
LMFTKDEIVDLRRLEKIGHSCLGPGGKLSFPIALGALRDRFFQVFEMRVTKRSRKARRTSSLDAK